MEQIDNQYFGKEKITRILIKLAPPVMLSQLIQALYNIVDSLFVGKNGASGLTALSILYPIQLLMIAIAVGTGVGINTIMASKFGLEKDNEAFQYAGIGTPLAIFLWLIFTIIMWFFMPIYAKMSTSSTAVIHDVIVYGRIVCVFSFGLFLESIWTKIIQAKGDMKTPMIAQILGALTNIILDPILIFGMFHMPKMGIAGAAIATVIGQMVAAAIVYKKGYYRPPQLNIFPNYIKRIYHMGYANILMQITYTFYIFGLNMILSQFSDQAVTVLGLYYKWQSFFFIPLNAMQTCIVPILSFNWASKNIERCKKTLHLSILFGMVLMIIGTLFFECIPTQMLSVFSHDPMVLKIGKNAFRMIGLSFIPLVTSLTFPVFFQAIGQAIKSSCLTILRTIILFAPLGYLLSLIGLDWFWLCFLLTEIFTTLIGFILYHRFILNQKTTI